MPPIVPLRPLRTGRPAAPPVVPGHASSLLILAPRGVGEATTEDPADYRVLMVDRSARGQFGGLTVFPGGKVEPVDHFKEWTSIATESHAFPDSVMPHALAAIRETFEETGLLLIRSSAKDEKKWTRDEVISWRKKIHDQSSAFLDMCRGSSSIPMTSRLAYWANWITPPDAPKRFDVKFFLTVLGDSTDVVINRIRERTVADGTEVLGVRWVTPKEAVDAFNDGKINLIDPQFALLSELHLRYPRLSLLRPFFTPTPRLRTPFELSPCVPEFAVLESGAEESKGVCVVMTGDPAHSTASDPSVLGGKVVKKTEQNRCLLFLKNLEQVLTNGGQYQYQGMKYVRELEWEKEEMANVRKVVEAELAALQGKARI